MRHAIEPDHRDHSPPATDPGAYACLLCNAVLNVTTTAAGRTFQHARPVDDGHEPQPVPATALTEVRFVCDFCNASNPIWSYHFDRLRINVEPSAGAATLDLAGTHDFGERWAACRRCANSIEAGDAAAIATRALRRIRRSGLAKNVARQHLLALHQTLLQSPRTRTSLQPPRPAALPTASPAPAAARSPRAGLLPKVRDRLTNYWLHRAAADLAEYFLTLPTLLIPHHLAGSAASGDLAAPLHTPDPAVLDAYTDLMGEHLADDSTRLYWIDPDHTRLAVDGAQVLPDLSIQPHQLPHPAGLVVWSEPIAVVGANELPIIAAQWGPVPGGTWITFFFPAERTHRTPPTDQELQHLRERYGWLVPITTGFGLPFNAPLTLADSDAHATAATLVATWLLTKDPIVSEAEDTPADKPIRKAYQRDGRREPTVRIVRLRPADTDRDTAPTAGAIAPTGRYHHQFWVGPFWRDTPYGPGRSLRERRIVRRHRRGPRDAPFLTTPKVHVLGSAASKTDVAPPSQ